MLRDNLAILVVQTILLVVAKVFGIFALTSDYWTTEVKTEAKATDLFTRYSEEKSLELVGMIVLIILGIVCIFVADCVLFARFFGQGRGKAILGGCYSVFAACSLAAAGGVFIATDPLTAVVGIGVGYGVTFALLWSAAGLSLIGGVLFFVLKDDAFLNADFEYTAAG